MTDQLNQRSTADEVLDGIDLTGKGGAYLENCSIADVVPNDPTFRGGVRDYAIDVEQADGLWNVSESLVSQILGS